MHACGRTLLAEEERAPRGCGESRAKGGKHGARCGIRHEFPRPEQRLAEVLGSSAVLAAAASLDEPPPVLLGWCSAPAHRGHVLLPPLSGFPRLVHPHHHEEAGGDEAELKLPRGCEPTTRYACATPGRRRSACQKQVRFCSPSLASFSHSLFSNSSLHLLRGVFFLGGRGMRSPFPALLLLLTSHTLLASSLVCTQSFTRCDPIKSYQLPSGDC